MENIRRIIEEIKTQLLNDFWIEENIRVLSLDKTIDTINFKFEKLNQGIKNKMENIRRIIEEIKTQLLNDFWIEENIRVLSLDKTIDTINFKFEKLNQGIKK